MIIKQIKNKVDALYIIYIITSNAYVTDLKIIMNIIVAVLLLLLLYIYIYIYIYIYND